MNPLINLVHLKFFCDAVVYKSISEAAKMNYITQSAVSQAIHKLEIILGTPLVIHNRQKFQITDEGRIVFEQARHIFKAVQDTFDKVNQTKEEITGLLKFVTTKSLGMSFLAPTYLQVRQNLPRVDLKFRMGGLNLIRTALKQEEAEFAIVVYDHNFTQFAKHPIRKGRLHLYHETDTPYQLLEDGIYVDDLEGMYIKELQEHVESTENASLKMQAIAGWELVARFTDLKIGIGFFPDYIVSNGRYPNIKIYPYETPPFEYEICAIYNKGTQLSRTALAFIDQFTTG